MLTRTRLVEGNPKDWKGEKQRAEAA